jgi:hypothetical protein
MPILYRMTMVKFFTRAGFENEVSASKKCRAFVSMPASGWWYRCKKSIFFYIYNTTSTSAKSMIDVSV